MSRGVARTDMSLLAKCAVTERGSSPEEAVLRRRLAETPLETACSRPGQRTCMAEEAAAAAAAHGQLDERRARGLEGEVWGCEAHLMGGASYLRTVVPNLEAVHIAAARGTGEVEGRAEEDNLVHSMAAGRVEVGDRGLAEHTAEEDSRLDVGGVVHMGHKAAEAVPAEGHGVRRLLARGQMPASAPRPE